MSNSNEEKEPSQQTEDEPDQTQTEDIWFWDWRTDSWITTVPEHPPAPPPRMKEAGEKSK
jgi:hypothetical protein